MGNQYWVARDDTDLMCVITQPVGEDGAAWSACTAGGGDGLISSGPNGVVATWSSTANPDVPDSSILLREHLVISRE